MQLRYINLVILGVIVAVSGQGYGSSGNGIPSWCPPGSPRIRCLVNPCDVDTCPAIPQAVCINDNPCEPSCVGNFYYRGQKITRIQCQQSSGY